MSRASRRPGFGPLSGAANRKFNIPGVTAGDDGYVIIWDNTNQTHDYTNTLDTFKLVTPLIDDGDDGVTLTSANQTNAAATVTIPDIGDAADNMVLEDTAQTLTNKTLTDPKINEDVVLSATATEIDTACSKSLSTSRLYNLGAPVVADDDRIVELTNMKNGAYTVADSPDISRNVTVTHISGDTTDTLGTITVTGTNYGDGLCVEEITPVADSTVSGIKAFKTITSVVGADWAIDGAEATNDQIKVGIGNELGLPLALDAESEMVLGILGTTITAHNPTIAVGAATIEETTIDMSAGTYDGSKAVLIFVVD
jgi:hypothetical protein